MTATERTDEQRAADRERQKRSRDNRKRFGLEAVTVWIWPEARELLHRYVKRLNERTGKGKGMKAGSRSAPT